MEKMFIYPETLDSKVAWGMPFDDMEPSHSRSDVASHRCKLYRTLLEQRTASQQARLDRMDHEPAAHGIQA
jgi:hypothetical protein